MGILESYVFDKIDNSVEYVATQVRKLIRGIYNGYEKVHPNCWVHFHSQLKNFMCCGFYSIIRSSA